LLDVRDVMPVEAPVTDKVSVRDPDRVTGSPDAE